MKRIYLTLTALIVVTSIFVLSGCEVNVDTSGTTAPASTTYAPATAVVEITNEEGTVLETQTVTMSPQNKEEEKNFFETIKPGNVSSSVSQDRLQQALQNQQVLTKPSVENTAPDINGDTGATNPPAENIPYVQDDAAVLRSSQYIINFRIADPQGVAENYKIAKNGNNTSVSMIYNDVPMSVILGENTWYLLSPQDKTYIEIPKEMVEESAAEDDEFTKLLLGDPFKFWGEVKSESTVTEDGVSYTVYEYDNGNKDYFIGKTIMKTHLYDGSIMYYDSVSPIAPMSLFTPPSDYTKTVVTEENASDIVESIDPNALSTTHNHDHEHE